MKSKGPISLEENLSITTFHYLLAIATHGKKGNK